MASLHGHAPPATALSSWSRAPNASRVLRAPRPSAWRATSGAARGAGVAWDVAAPKPLLLRRGLRCRACRVWARRCSTAGRSCVNSASAGFTSAALASALWRTCPCSHGSTAGAGTAPFAAWLMRLQGGAGGRRSAAPPARVHVDKQTDKEASK
eukprot:352622-Chlamydomonas_euryale.AAC.7